MFTSHSKFSFYIIQSCQCDPPCLKFSEPLDIFRVNLTLGQHRATLRITSMSLPDSPVDFLQLVLPFYAPSTHCTCSLSLQLVLPFHAPPLPPPYTSHAHCLIPYFCITKAILCSTTQIVGFSNVFLFALLFHKIP